MPNQVLRNAALQVETEKRERGNGKADLDALDDMCSLRVELRGVALVGLLLALCIIMHHVS